MIAMALKFFGLLQGVHRMGFGGSMLAVSLRSLLAARSQAAPIALGVFNGFLPCPLVYAFVAQAASTAAPLAGMLVMLAFGLGTFPAMLAMGGIGPRPRSGMAPARRAARRRLHPDPGCRHIGRGMMPFDSHDAHAGPTATHGHPG